MSLCKRKNGVCNFKKCPASEFIPITVFTYSKNLEKSSNYDFYRLNFFENNKICTTHFCNHFGRDGIRKSRNMMMYAASVPARAVAACYELRPSLAKKKPDHMVCAGCVSVQCVPQTHDLQCHSRAHQRELCHPSGQFGQSMPAVVWLLPKEDHVWNLLRPDLAAKPRTRRETSWTEGCEYHVT